MARRLTTNQEILGSIPSAIIFLFWRMSWLTGIMLTIMKFYGGAVHDEVGWCGGVSDLVRALGLGIFFLPQLFDCERSSDYGIRYTRRWSF